MALIVAHRPNDQAIAVQETWVGVPYWEWGIAADEPYKDSP